MTRDDTEARAEAARLRVLQELALLTSAGASATAKRVAQLSGRSSSRGTGIILSRLARCGLVKKLYAPAGPRQSRYRVTRAGLTFLGWS